MNKATLFICWCLCVSSAFCVSEEMQELIDSLHSTCVAETGVDEAIITKINTAKVMVDDEKLKCYLKCLMEQTASISDDGVIDVEAVIALLPEDMAAKTSPIIRACGSKKGANACESAWLTHKCYIENGPELYVLF